VITLVDGAPGTHVPVTDRGFGYGDGVFEVLFAEGHRVRALDLHLARLARSAALLGIDPGAHIAGAGADVARVVAASPDPAYVRIVLTRGDGLGVDPPSGGARRVVLATPAPGAVARVIRAITVRGHPSPVPAAKTLSLAGHVVHRLRAREAGADEALIVEGELVREATAANVLVVVDGILRAPVDRALAGITRHIVLGLARASAIPVDEGDLETAELARASEVILTSTVRGVVPVSCVDDRPVAGEDGTIWRTLARAYTAELREHMAEVHETTKQSGTVSGAR
jgi:branched-subunit amino acid aminotransferase/4-amino-4-deoxychorismate lyase